MRPGEHMNVRKYRGKQLSDDQPCIFCGEPADSREDIIPTWLNKQALMPPETTRPVTYTSHGVVLKEWTSQTLAFLKIKAVCMGCNNGWMSQVETAAKPYLELMMKGNNVLLDQAAQVTLATWACLKVMVWESVAEGVVTSPSDRQLMCKQQVPPAYALVALGRVPSSDQSEFSVQQVFIKAQRQPGAARDSVSATALTLGDMVAWVVLNPTRPAAMSLKPTPIDLDLITIFPPAAGSLRWPPRVTLTAEELRDVWRRYIVLREEEKVEHLSSGPTDPPKLDS
jgi:hypothetical protein